jgi:FlaA1/EpsC-like NDP-sugar epimerase
VRFGNVLGSRGSVVPTFARQVREGGPVTVTDARMTRFFMTISEAVQLVLQAATMSRGDEVFMLEMGRPVGILDLAHRMVRLAGKRPGVDVEIRIVGARAGEKLTEQLHTPDEQPEETAHPSIFSLRPVGLDPRVLTQSIRTLARLCDLRDEPAVADLLLAVARGTLAAVEGADDLTLTISSPGGLAEPIDLVDVIDLTDKAGLVDEVELSE